jgi:hypothetical protein
VRRWRRRVLGAAALAFVALAPGRAAATVVVAKDFAALCAEADLIFVGTVTGRESRWSDPSHQAIETLVTFGDVTWLRGTAQPSVTLHFAGGEVDGLREEIAGVPQFAVGERRVIFARAGRFVSPIVGFDQGALRVVEGSNGPVVSGPRSAGGADGEDVSGHGVLRLGTPQPDQSGGPPVALDEYLDRVRRQLDGPVDAAP